ncbi:MAG: hypothetical protein FWG26_05040 [Betaproteobacteria bacterium]|jgi:hypothetical protein|nr:hypothetical protein [Betaproteobacteria bacterium]
MKRNRLNGVVYGLLLGLSVAGQQAQAMGTHDALSGRLAELHIVDRTAGVRLPVYWHDGKAYVVGNPGNEYEISLTNRIAGDLLAVVSVDGVNVLSGQTASSQQDGYVYSGGDSYSIRGWRKSREQTAAFYFTSLSDSYAGRTGRPGNVGVIGVALFQRKQVAVAPRSHISESQSDYSQLPQPSSIPAQEIQADRAQDMTQMAEKSMDSQALAKRAAPNGSVYRPQRERLGTGHGRIEDSPVNFVKFERATRRPAEVLTIYYDSYVNLAVRGIVPTRGDRVACAGNSRQAGCSRPFPGDPQTGFVPDPPR